MAMSKSNIATGLSVFGLLAVVFGTVLVFVGPVVIDNQIVKVSLVLQNRNGLSDAK